jgi:hypothetical protein
MFPETARALGSFTHALAVLRRTGHPREGLDLAAEDPSGRSMQKHLRDGNLLVILRTGHKLMTGR